MATKKPTGTKKATRKPRKKVASTRPTPPLTIRQQRLAKLIEENLTAPKPRPLAKLMRDAGYSEAVATKAASRMVGVISKKLGWADQMDKAGITNEALMAVLGEGLLAKKQISAVVGKDADGATVDFVDVEDHPTRHKYLDTALKLKSAYPNDKLDVAHTGDINVNIVKFGKKGK